MVVTTSEHPFMVSGFKYRAGDRVVVRPDLEIGKPYFQEDYARTSMVCCTKHMQHAGEVVKIRFPVVHHKTAYIITGGGNLHKYEDSEGLCWVDGMFVGLESDQYCLCSPVSDEDLEGILNG